MGKRYDSMVTYKTLVLGASTNPQRYSHQAVVLLKKNNIQTVPMGVKSGTIEGLEIIPAFTPLDEIHTVSLYLSPFRQNAYFDYIIELNPKRVVFNPGTENPVFTQKLNLENIPWENACTLVLLSTNQYQS
ncbi:MAG: CoA-binding protein [Flavobacteriaceae bacterium]